MIDNTIFAAVSRFAAVASLLVLAWPVLAASSEPLLEDDNLRTKVMIEKLKAAKTLSQMNMPKRNTGECGDINIGNAEPAKGSSAIAAREKNVIVLGPVIKADQCR